MPINMTSGCLTSDVYMQNQKVEESSLIFPKSEIYTLGRIDVDSIGERLETLRYELEALPNVDAVAYSSQARTTAAPGRSPWI